MLLDGRPLRTGRIGALGEPAHGVFWLTAAEQPTQRFRPSLVLAPLARPLVGELRTLVNRGSVIRVPAADRDRFLAEVVPTIRHAAALVSADDSVRLPRARAAAAGVRGRLSTRAPAAGGLVVRVRYRSRWGRSRLA